MHFSGHGNISCLFRLQKYMNIKTVGTPNLHRYLQLLNWCCERRFSVLELSLPAAFPMEDRVSCFCVTQTLLNRKHVCVWFYRFSCLVVSFSVSSRCSALSRPAARELAAIRPDFESSTAGAEGGEQLARPSHTHLQQTNTVLHESLSSGTVAHPSKLSTTPLLCPRQRNISHP